MVELDVQLKQAVIKVIERCRINLYTWTLQKVQGDATVHMSTLWYRTKCCKDVQTGEADLHDKPWSGCPCIEVTPDNIHQVDDLMYSNHHINKCWLCPLLSFGKGSLMTIPKEFIYANVYAS